MASRRPARKKKTTARKGAAKKAPARRSAARNARKRKPQQRRKRHVGRWLLGGLVLCALLLGGYSTYLGQTVRVAFEGKRWSIPARVYARPLELYVGAPVSTQQLAYELEILGYRKVARPAAGAQWSRSGDSFVIHSRDFHFWDGPVAAHPLRLRIEDGHIAALQRRDNDQPLDLVRLEPAVIGSIYPAHREDRVLVRREEIPGHLVQALLAIEDRRFFEHFGVDPRGIARALWTNLQAGGMVQGGSTLTQQLVKNFILSPERTLTRKLNEALMALIVESRYAKDEILEAYANEIYLGQDRERAIHGFGLGALFYFNRPLDELEVHETALLVGLVKGASFYNPRRHPERAKQRRDLVLDAMAGQGFIDVETARQAKARPLGVSQRGRLEGHRYPAFIQLVRRQLQRDYHEEDLTSEGLRVFTTLDPWDQRQAARGVSRQLERIEQARGIEAGSLQAAMVIASPQEGEVRALVGGRDTGVSGFNRALDAVRPIGSLVKPAVYLSALAEPGRYTLATLLQDEPVDLALPNGDRWTPRNYDRKTHGTVPLHRALADSLNLATVHLGLEIGVPRVLQTLQRLGLDRPAEPYPSLLLGALQLSPLEVTQLYQTIAAGGFRAPLRAIREVLDARQQPLQRYPLDVEQSVDPVAVFLLTSNLQEVVQDGTARGLSRYVADVEGFAGKTGTTNDLRDAWFAGFSGDRVATVWVGRDDNRPIGLTGSSGAVPLFGAVMQQLRPAPLIQAPPRGVEYVWVEPASGMRSAAECPGARMLPFARGSAPHTRSSCAARANRGFLERLFD
jgi:penicillin-binding protein 1B